MRERALRRPVVLPKREEVLGLLEAASPRSAVGLKVPQRTWPETPEVDVSVIVPCYNVERFVEGCVRSITSQETSRTFEVICVDDGSTDATGEILDTLAEGDERVRVLNQANRGFSGARNAGLAEIRGRGGRLCGL
jgi:cellulose synthase/poly-beta-1,6-N-acetylglucosamine synthase-like glycosyltransferase